MFQIGAMRGVTSRSLVLVSSMLLSALPIFAAAEPVMVVPGQYIVQRKKESSPTAQALRITSYEVSRRARNFEVVTPHSVSVSLRTSASREPLNWATVRRDCDEIKKDPTIETCDPDVIRKIQLAPNDPSFSQQWALRDLAGGADIGAGLAWDVGTGSADPLIGVIDTGIYRQHLDLSANIWSNPNEPVDGQDNDGNGYVDDSHGVSTSTGSADFSDCNGHGTHVAGIIGARGNNGVGIAGVNWTASLIAVNTDADCSGSSTVSAIIDAYDYFYDLKQRGHAIRVINASFGGEGEIVAEEAAIQRLASVDILLVAAAGNDNRILDDFPSYPASYDLPNIITVGATGPTKVRAWYSNYGQSVDIAAPGGDSDFTDGMILSTFSPDATAGVFYKYLQGTSMATPMVTGAVALLASLRSELTGAQLKQLVLNSASTVPALNGKVASGRFLNLLSMVNSGDPEDECPSDPNKSSPGVCGCGVTDSYTDSDGDLSLDCVDGCVSDPLKSAAGTCGCEVSDSDSNQNGTPDCLDPDITNLTPPKPRVSISGSKMLIKMSDLEGVEYVIEVGVTGPRSGGRAGKLRTTYYKSTAKSGFVRKPSRGSSVKVRYAYRVFGAKTGRSFWSPFTRLRVVR